MKRGLHTGLTVGLPISCGLWALIIHIVSRGLPVTNFEIGALVALTVCAIVGLFWAVME